MPKLLSELAAARCPTTYVDDMLGQTGQPRPRPAWASLERWLPMDVARRATPSVPNTRPLLILVILGLLIAAVVAFYAGSRTDQAPRVVPAGRQLLDPPPRRGRRHLRMPAVS
jgi:hypothetical protein